MIPWFHHTHAQALLTLEISGPNPFESLELLAYEAFLPLINNQQNQVRIHT